MRTLQLTPQYQSVIPSLSTDQFGLPSLRLAELILRLRYASLRMTIVLAGLFVFTTETAHAETPTEAVDRLWNAAFDAKGAFYSPQGIWSLSRTIAHEQGVAVIPPIMARSKDWKSEEVLVFIPVVYLLPQEKAIPVLKKFQSSGKPWEQQCATDLLIEITDHADDLKGMEEQAAKE